MIRKILILILVIGLLPLSASAQRGRVKRLRRNASVHQTQHRAKVKKEKPHQDVKPKVEERVREAAAQPTPIVTEVPGVGRITSFPLIPESYALGVESKRGHDHFVPMNFTRIVQRWNTAQKGKDFHTAWEEIGGKMHYTYQHNLAQDLDKLYQGNGVPAIDMVGRQPVRIYALPFDGIVYEPLGKEPKTLDPTQWLVVYHYSGKARGTIISFDEKGLRFFKLENTAQTPAP